jgi:hypothetical protein
MGLLLLTKKQINYDKRPTSSKGRVRLSCLANEKNQVAPECSKNGMYEAINQKVSTSDRMD